MGHLGHLKQEYRDLLTRLEAGQVGLPWPEDPAARRGMQEILEILYTADDATLAARIPVRPASLNRIATRLGVAPEELRPRLDALADKGLVLDLVHPETGKVKYALAPPVVGFFEFSLMRMHDSIPKKKMAEALHAYCHGDEAFARHVFGERTVVGRAMVNEEVLGDEPRPDVLDWQRATAAVEEATVRSVSLCYCRHKAEHLSAACDVPVETCLALNAGADFVVRRKFGRAIDKAEALDILARCRAMGLVQIADNVMQKPVYLCNCCGCCCGQLQAINEFDLPAVNPSGFVPHSAPDACTGCSRCARACPITAISMVAQTGGPTRRNKLSPRIDVDRCIGCGVCAHACRKHAMTMQRSKRQPHVPSTGIERMVRMALERGRLPHLLVDQGASRGARFLNTVLQAVCRLPVAKQAIASEQLQSRFVRYALRTVKDPTG